MSSSGAGDTSATNSTDRYMENFTALFEADIAAVYEQDASAETLKQLTACIEVGSIVFNDPLVVDE